VIAIENTRLLNELRQRTDDLTESLEQQTATSEVLQVISSSPGELQPVFQTMLANATRICSASFGTLLMYEGDVLRRVALHNGPQLLVDDWQRRSIVAIDKAPSLKRLVSTKQVVHIVDIAADHPDDTIYKLAGARTLMVVPMLKENELIGALSIYRQEVRPFTAKQIALVTNFAAQAVIAIENTRLLSELRQRTDDLTESLEQQTATSEVLRVISGSPTDAQPVFDMIAESVWRLCEAQYCFVYRFDGGLLHFIAHHGLTPEVLEMNTRTYPLPPSRKSAAARAVLERKVVQIPDVQADPEFILGPMASVGGFGSVVGVPILREGVPVGSIALTRVQTGLLPERQIELLKTFADQAVIAIENARLFSELRESLEQQTATSEVLGVISSSPGDLKPVFEAMLANAVRVCGSTFGALHMREGDMFRTVALHGASPTFVEARMRDGPFTPGAGTGLARVAVTKQFVHIEDITSDAAFQAGDSRLRQAAIEGGVRTLLAVPMLKEQELVGVIAIYRSEVKPFADKQIELVQNFAAQAVIAIENTRLLNELRESLEQQTATSEVLKVISSSPGDLKPVFEAILDNATRICEANFGVLHIYDGNLFHFAAVRNAPEQLLDFYRGRPSFQPPSGTPLDRLLKTKGIVRTADDSVAEVPSAPARLAGAKSHIAVPMLKDGALAGAIVIYRQEVRPFTDKQVELVKNFAAQAVIAIENARLLNELRQRTDDLSEALEQQTATAEMLQVINTSPGNLSPVFDAMVESAMRFCQADYGHVYSYDGKLFHLVAAHGEPRYLDWIRQGGPRAAETSLTLERIVAGDPLVHIADIAEDSTYRAGNPRARTIVDEFGIHTLLTVALRKDDALLGTFVLYRQIARPFADKQIALVQNFAAQAVIAMENARLLNELRQRTDDLSEALEYQTATSEVLNVISRSPNELQPVLDAILQTAGRLCEAEYACFFKLQDGKYHLAGSNNAEAAYVKFLSEHPISPGRSSLVGRAAVERRTVHMSDCLADPEYESHDYQRVGKHRSMLGVPLLRDGEPIAVIGLLRTVVKPFTQKQIDLVTTFADQAMIAIENVRLFEAEQQRTAELTEALEQQTATSEVLRVISSSPGELAPVFKALLDNAARICEAKFGMLVLAEGEGKIRVAAMHGAPPQLAEKRTREPVFTPGPSNNVAITARTKKIQHVADLRLDPSYLEREPAAMVLADLAGARTLVVVPMLKDDEFVGAFGIYRQEVRPFTDKQIALLENFAAQAVIAIENTRLLKELRQRTDDLTESLEQQTATSEVLQVISKSPGELQPVFQAMLENAVRICGAKFGNLWLREGDAFRIGATHGAPQAYVDFLRSEPLFHPDPELNLGQMVRAKEAFQTADVAAVGMRRDKMRQALIELAGARTLIGVPMLKDNEVVGAIGIYRQEVRPFTDKQIELVKNFANQAVIAIENTRLLKELRRRTDDLSEALEQQTATAEVLKVISSSPGELEPVFQAMLANATRICGAKFGTLALYEGDAFRLVALHDAPAALSEDRQRQPIIQLAPGHHLLSLVKTKQMVHIADIAAEKAAAPRLAKLGGARTLLTVPMLKENELIGAMAIYRQEVRPFTDKQIELVKNFAAQAVIAIENARLLSELRESLDQQTATSEVLQIISGSSGQLGPVFASMLQNAVRLCGATFGNIYDWNGEVAHVIATHNSTPAAFAAERKHSQDWRPHPKSPVGRMLASRSVVHVADLAKDAAYTERADSVVIAAVELGGVGTVLFVPMLRKEGELIGFFAVACQRVRPFANKQIELVTNFAAQAVIAIENTRLLNELRESLQQQTATADVLKVISRSAFDLQSVLDTLIESAARLCEADYAWLFQREGEFFSWAAGFGHSTEEYARIRDYFKTREVRAERGSITGRCAIEGKVIHVTDVLADPDYTWQGAQEIGHYRAALGAPLLREGNVVGVIFLSKKVPQPFTAKQIELVTTFADQAVIAIENVRLFDDVQKRTQELSEALEQQTATSEVLRVISSSPGELKPVFEAMLMNATRICGAKFGSMFLREGDAFSTVALHNAPPAFAEAREGKLIQPHPESGLGRLVKTKQLVHIADITQERSYIERDPSVVVSAELGGYRTVLAVPMLKENELVGAIVIYRQEVCSFSDKQVELLTNFAAQAVIAIENTRLLKELRQRTDDLSEALEQQTATSEVLEVISSSPGELQPVFDALLANATRLCGASYGAMWLREGEAFRTAALHGDLPAAYLEQWRSGTLLRPSPNTPLARVTTTRQPVLVPDMRTDPSYLEGGSLPVSAVEVAGIRTLFAVPMLRENNVVGAIAIYRTEVRPFSDKQIQLLTNFAAQAVIAIENTRLLSELRESLQQQTATADVLKVISRSTFDLQAVLNTLVESATRLCEAYDSVILLRDGERLRVRAHYGPIPVDFVDWPIGRGWVTGRAFIDHKPIHVHDLQTAVDEYPDGSAMAIRLGHRTILATPLMREGEAIGALMVRRTEVKPFTDKQIALVTTFANQAVIAIENVRLFNSVEARTRELSASLEELRTAQNRLIQTEKLASLGQLTAGIAHEIKNPLNFVNNFSAISVELIDELRQALAAANLDDDLRGQIGEVADMLQGNLDKVVQHGKRADSIVKNMLLHSRQGSGEHRPVDINAVVEESLNLAYHGARAEKQGFNITLERSFDPAAGEVDLFPQEITRVLLNLISNGFYAATKRKAETNGGGYEPTLAAVTRNLGDSVEIRIRDNGTGIPPEVKERMFNPFFTTKPAGEGTGLGLSLSYDIIVKQHAGSIEVDTQPGEFTEFRIVLPRGAATIAKSGETA